MSVNFIARKCACGGTLEFAPSKKVWICKYCGTVIEREATFDKIHVDGLEGINDVVRQTLMDVANQKMESAARNLADCERKGHEHIGTLLAYISFYLANISVAKSQNEVRASMDKVKVFANRLQREYPIIAEDELNLYEDFGKSAADIFANLLAVFDTLGDNNRLEYIFAKLEPSQVLSPYANKALLRIAIKKNKLDVVEAIISNIGCLDRKSALQEILERYPDDDNKGRIIKKLFDEETANALSDRYFESYFLESHDSVATKSNVIALLNATAVHCRADWTVKALTKSLHTYDEAKLLFDCIYSIKINDRETEALFEHCLSDNKEYCVQAAFLDALKEHHVFVALNGRTIISFLENAEHAINQKAEILQKLLSFQVDHKALDAIYNYYLNQNADAQEVRKTMIDVLLIKDAPISAETIKTYALKTQTDGDAKIQVIEKIFATGINITYLGDLLSEYLLEASDGSELKNNISDYFIALGFKADSSALVQYVSSDDDNSLKFEKIKQLIKNGTMARADTLDHYILSVAEPGGFSQDIFNLLTQSNYIIGFQAYAKFILTCQCVDKVRDNEIMLNALNCDIRSQNASIVHCKNNLNCNIAQAYALLSTECYEDANEILRRLLSFKVKLNSDITVNGRIVKFKKYVGEHKSYLSPLSLRLCDENKLFSLF